MAEAVSGLTGSLQGTVGGMFSKGQAWIDSVFPPERRNELMAKISKFATEKPMLASFLASQIALTGFPLGLFAVMTISVVVFALLAGLIIGLLGAVLFIVAAVGFALIILLPVLFFTTAAATFIWLWGLAGYYIIKWFNKKEIPGIHTEMNDTVPDAVKGQLGGITGEDKSAGQANGGPKEANGGPKQPNGKSKESHAKHKEGKDSHDGKAMNGVADKVGSAGKSTGVDVGNPKEAADVGKHAGKVQNAAGGATNAVGGAKSAVSGTVGL